MNTRIFMAAIILWRLIYREEKKVVASETSCPANFLINHVYVFLSEFQNFY